MLDPARAEDVMDFEGRHGRPHIDLRELPAVEFLMSLAVITDRPSMRTLEVGRSWLALTERAAGHEVLERARFVAGEGRRIWLHLAGYAVHAGIRRVDELIELAEGTPAEVLHRCLVGWHNRVPLAHSEAAWSILGPVELERALAGDAKMLAVVRQRARGLVPDWLFTTSATRTKQLLVKLLTDWAQRAWPNVADVVGSALKDDVARKERQIGTQFGDALGRFLPGVSWDAPSSELRALVLAPSYISRPWVSHAEALGTMTLVYPVDDAVLGRSGEHGLRHLGRLSAAHAAPHRAAILQALQGGALTLAQVSAKLGVAEADALPDLVALRSAGLISADVRTRRYRLEQAPIDDLGQLLRAVADVLDSRVDEPYGAPPS